MIAIPIEAIHITDANADSERFIPITRPTARPESVPMPLPMPFIQYIIPKLSAPPTPITK